MILLSWTSAFDLPWDNQQPLQVIEFFAGVSRIAKAAAIEGYEARSYDLNHDTPLQENLLTPRCLKGLLLTFAGRLVLRHWAKHTCWMASQKIKDFETSYKYTITFKNTSK